MINNLNHCSLPNPVIMLKTNIEIIGELKTFLFTATNDKHLYVNGPKSFTRNRKLTFPRLVVMLINMLKKSLSVELYEFFNLLDINQSYCTKSAFSQARKKLRHLVFQDWNQVLLRAFYTNNDQRINKWANFLVYGVDGSTMFLIDKADVVEHFGVQINKKADDKPMARIMICYDVLNHLAVRADLVPYNQSESSIARGWLPDYDKDTLLVYDRGYPGFAFIYLHQLQNLNFVMRCTVGFNKQVREFVRTQNQSVIIDIPGNSDAIRDLKKAGYSVDKNTCVRVRLVKVILPGGETEILITSLTDQQQYPGHIFKQLYFMRWGVETFIDGLKNKLQLENFSGQTVQAIKQDFYAMIFTANLHSLLVQECNAELNTGESNTKFSYQVNKNVSIGILKGLLVKIFLTDKEQEIVTELKKLFIKHKEPIRPGRSYSRDIKKRRSKGKFQTMSNYKPAI